MGGFVQDSWSVLDKVTVNLGARYDAQHSTATDGKLGLTLPNQWSPRLGLIYDPTQRGGSKFFVNYARYYENAPLDLADVALAGEPQIKGAYTSGKDMAGMGDDAGKCSPCTFAGQKPCDANNAIVNPERRSGAPEQEVRLLRFAERGRPEHQAVVL